jgi:hypothetical protein
VTTTRPRPLPTGTTTRPRPWRLLVVGCFALAGLSLLGPRSPTYDPWSWLNWGREIVQGDLVTTAAPSWKPLPVAFTTVFALFGTTAAPLLWLVVARAGGLLAIAMAYRLADRIAGVAAGIIAAAGLTLESGFVDGFLRGNSEGILVALVLWAIERHLEGRHQDAFVLGAVAALLRPETWPFLAVYGLWLSYRAWGGPQRVRVLALVLGTGVALLVVWLVPEYLGSGHLLRGATRAREPVAGTPAQAAVPFLATFSHSESALSWAVYAGAVIGTALALWTWVRERRVTVTLGLAALATVLMLIVALLAQAGFTGNLRYVTLPAAILCAVAGAGWVGFVALFRRRWGTAGAAAGVVVALAVSVPPLIGSVDKLGSKLRVVKDDSDLLQGLPPAIRQAGGRAAVTRCQPVRTVDVDVPGVAYALEIPSLHVSDHPQPPGTILVPNASSAAGDARLRLLARNGQWTIRSSCR